MEISDTLENSTILEFQATEKPNTLSSCYSIQRDHVQPTYPLYYNEQLQLCLFNLVNGDISSTDILLHLKFQYLLNLSSHVPKNKTISKYLIKDKLNMLLIIVSNININRKQKQS